MGRRVRILASLAVILLTAIALTPAADAGLTPAHDSLVSGGGESVGTQFASATAPVPSVADPETKLEKRGTLGLGGWWYVTPVLVILTATDDVGVASTWFSLNRLPWQLYGVPFSVSTDGNHTVEFLSVDTEGRSESTKSTRVPIDRNPPVFLDLRPQGTVTSGNVLLQWNTEDQGSGVAHSEVSVDGGAFQNVGVERSTPVQLSNGRHTVRLMAFDLAGNNASTEYAFQVDTSFLSVTGPQGTILLALIVGVNAAAVFAVLILRRRRRP